LGSSTAWSVSVVMRSSKMLSLVDCASACEIPIFTCEPRDANTDVRRSPVGNRLSPSPYVQRDVPGRPDRRKPTESIESAARCSGWLRALTALGVQCALEQLAKVAGDWCTVSQLQCGAAHTRRTALPWWEGGGEANSNLSPSLPNLSPNPHLNQPQPQPRSKAHCSGALTC